MERFSTEPDLTHLLIAAHDWMTNRQVMGLHVFRSSYRWNTSKEAYFVDMVDQKHHLETDRDELAPAAIHRGDPSPFQAFYFGLHKAVKFTQLTCEDPKLSQRETHWRHFKWLDRHYRETKHHVLALARIGFLHALTHGFHSRHVDYSCVESLAAFKQYADLDIA